MYKLPFHRQTVSSLQILDVRFCAVVGGASYVLGVGWKSAFTELFVFALGDPTAPTGLEGRSFGSSMQGSGKANEVGLGLGLGLSRGLLAEFLTKISLLEIVSTGEKSKERSKAESFCSWRTISGNVFPSEKVSFKYLVRFQLINI